VNGVLVGTRHMEEPWLYRSRLTILDRLISKNPLVLWVQKRGWFDNPNPFMAIVVRQFFERQAHWASKDRPADRDTVNDVLLKTQQEHPEVPDFSPLVHSTSAIGAGVEATAITISSIFYFLLKNQHCYTKLKEELDSNLGDSKGPVSWAVAQNLPYLNAVINESMRCHMVTRLPFTRETPAGGLTVCGTWVPPGMSVSVYAPVVHQSREVFGEDVKVFRPERWLEDKEKAKQMQNTLFHFGHGKYSCLGKSIARLEIIKMIPSVLREFDFTPTEPKKDWTLLQGPFTPPVDFRVKLKPRNVTQVS